MERPVKRLELVEGGERLRRRPGKRAAERAPAEAQAHRDQLVAALLEPGTGETHEHAALLHPIVHPLHEVARQGADVGHDQHGRVLLEGLAHRCREIGVLGAHQLGERSQRFLDVVERRQQRLRLLTVLARDEPDPVPTGACIEQVHRARRALASDLHARDLVAKLEWHLEPYRGAVGARSELEGRLAEPLAACRKRKGNAGSLSAIGAQDVRLELAVPAETGGGSHCLIAGAALNHHNATRSCEARELVGERARLAVVVDAVRQPDDAGLRFAGQRALKMRRRFRALRLEGLRLQRCRRGPGGVRRLDAQGLCLTGRRRLRDQDRAALAFGFRDQAIDEACALGEARGCRPAIVDDNDDRTRALQRRIRVGVEHRLGQRQDHQGGCRHADQGQPPRRLGRRLLAIDEVEQDARGRESHTARARRNGAQQPVDERQRRQRAEQPRIDEGERAERHRVPPSAAPTAKRSALAPVCNRAINASSGSAAERSV